MDYRNLGASDLRVSAVGLGCNNFGASLDAGAAERVIHAALDNGVTFFDTAAAYKAGASETFLGQALQGRRGKAVIATKFGGQGDPDMGPAAGPKGAPAYIELAVDAALMRLKTDYIDLLQLHRPDPETPLEETLAALDRAIRAGKVRYAGCSGFLGAQLLEAADIAERLGVQGFISAMTEWSLLHRDAEAEFVPAALKAGCGVLPAFPLASGLLTGKVGRDGSAPANSRLAGWAAKFVTDERLEKVERLRGWADGAGRTLVEVAVGWLAAQPAVGSVIAGASTPEQVAVNAHAADWRPTPEQISEISSL